MYFNISLVRSIPLVLLLNAICSQAFGFGDVQVACDVNNDGTSAVFVGAPSDDEKRGAVFQYNSNGSKLRWSQRSEGVIGTDEPDDRFGSSLAAGDFNNDGYCDIAIGVPYEDLGSIKNAGSVTILYGSIDGLNKGLKSHAWNERTRGIKGVPEAEDHFGGELAVGDFNNDGNDDLAIGIRDENIGSLKDAGTVLVLYGSDNGLTDENQLWSENSKGIKGVSEAYDRFGETLATGDFDNDGFADLAIGITGEDVGSIKNAGSVLVLYGSAAGLSARDQVWTENSPGIKGVAEAFDYFGEALVSGDFDGDNYADLAIGLPWENAGSRANSGTVLVLYGSSKGLSDRDQLWSQDSKGIKGLSEAGDRFGSSLLAYDEDNDGFDELVIGIPYEDVGTVVDAGSVLMLYGSSRGLTDKDIKFNRRDGDFAGAIIANARFGDSLAVRYYSGGFDSALSVGEPGTSTVVRESYVYVGTDSTIKTEPSASLVLDLSPPSQNLIAQKISIINGENRIGYTVDLLIELEAEEPQQDVEIAVFAIDLGANKQIPIGANSIETLNSGFTDYELEVELPTSLVEGAYYLAVFVDGSDGVAESNEQDNEAGVYVDLAPAETNIDLSLDQWLLESNVLALDTQIYEAPAGGVQNSDANGTAVLSIRGNTEPVAIEAFTYLLLTRSDGGFVVDDSPIFFPSLSRKQTDSDPSTHTVPLYLWDSEEARYMNAFAVDTNGNSTDEEWLSLGQLSPQQAGQDGKSLVLEAVDGKSAHLDVYLPGLLAREIEIAARHLFVVFADPTYPPPDLSTEAITDLRSFLRGLPASNDINNDFDEGPAFEVLGAQICTEIRAVGPDLVDRNLDDNVRCSDVALSLPPMELAPPNSPYNYNNRRPTNALFIDESYDQKWGSDIIGIGLSLYTSMYSEGNQGLRHEVGVDVPLYIAGAEFKFVETQAGAFLGFESTITPKAQDFYYLRIGVLGQVLHYKEYTPSFLIEKTYSYSKSKRRNRTFRVGPIPVNVDLLAIGTIGAKLELSGEQRTLDAKATPFVNAYAQATAYAGAKTVGVQGRLTLIDDKLEINPSLSAVLIADRQTSDGYTVALNITPSLTITNDLTGMSGYVKLFLSIPYPTLVSCSWGFFTGVCPGISQVTYYKTIVEWAGWKQKDTLLDISTDIEIVTIEGFTSHYPPVGG